MRPLSNAHDAAAPKDAAKKSAAAHNAVAANFAQDAASMVATQEQLNKAMELLQLTQQQGKKAATPVANAAGAAAAAAGPMVPVAPKNLDDAKIKTYEFWSTQPVPKLDEKITTNEEIEPDKSVDAIRGDPYSLPDGFRWDTLDLNEPLVLKELYTLLNENYVEDDDNMFRFDYSPDFLKWALQPPGWLLDWHVGVRVVKSKKLVGFISAIPANVRIYDR